MAKTTIIAGGGLLLAATWGLAHANGPRQERVITIVAPATDDDMPAQTLPAPAPHTRTRTS
jgi:hypothetical protein